MSKSDPEPNSAIYLTDTDDQITKKLKRAVTDSGSEVTYEDSKPGVKNLLDIQAAITGRQPQKIATSYTGKMYGHLKAETAEIIVQAVRPIRDKADALMKDRAELDRILAQGAAVARARASRKLRQVYDKLGFVPAK